MNVPVTDLMRSVFGSTAPLDHHSTSPSNMNLRLPAVEQHDCFSKLSELARTSRRDVGDAEKYA